MPGQLLQRGNSLKALASLPEAGPTRRCVLAEASRRDGGSIN
ncbi:MAG: hypothetical protein V7K20_17810 [Nostoc sp.]